LAKPQRRHPGERDHERAVAAKGDDAEPGRVRCVHPREVAGFHSRTSAVRSRRFFLPHRGTRGSSPGVTGPRMDQPRRMLSKGSLTAKKTPRALIFILSYKENRHRV